MQAAPAQHESIADLSLCRYSRSETLTHLILTECPLKLTGSQQGACPCKRRKYHVGPYDVRVVECLFPRTYRGNAIKDPERLRQSIAARVKSEKSMSSNQTTKPGETTMTTAVADPPRANGATRATKPAAATAAATTAAPSPENNAGLWCGIPIPVLGVSGEKGEGKTLLVSSIAPEETLMLDLEDSSASYSSIPYKKRLSLYEEMLRKFNRIPTPLECFEWFRDVVTTLKPGEYRVLAVDPITDIEQGLVDWVYANPQHFNHTKAQYDKGGGIMWGDVKSYWKMLLGIVATKVETLAFTAHMGAVWKGSAPVEGKRKAKGKETLFELASLYLEVERPIDKDGKKPAKPSARVTKSRLAISRFVDGEIVHTPILPPYLKEATPKAIREYIKNPPDYAKLKKTEIAPPQEMTEDDRLLIKAGIAENERAAAEASLSRLEQMRKAAEDQARMKREREEQQAANSAKVDVTQTVNTATVTTETGTVLPASHAVLAGVQEAGDRADLKQLHAAVNDLFAALQSTPATIADILGKRGVKAVEELMLAQAEEIRGKLQLVVNKRIEKAKAAQGGDIKTPFD